MRARIITILLCAFVVSVYTASVFAADYDHELEERGIKFSWKVAGSDLHVKVSAKTTGWVGVGFNPVDQMKGANIIIGYVKKGKVVIRDDFGDEERNHNEDEKLGGKNDVTVVGGEEKGGMTTLEFSIPLNSGDSYDSVIDPEGETILLLSYGGKRDSFISKHKDKFIKKVNLSSGKVY